MRTRLFGTLLILLTTIFLSTACTTTNKVASPSNSNIQANVTSSGGNTSVKSTEAVSEQVYTIKIGSTSYEVSYPPGKGNYFQAISTTKGIVWNSVPSIEGEYLSAHPTTPFILYLSPSTVTKLETSNAQKILVLPLQMDTPIGKMNVLLGSLFATDDWVVYYISLSSPGMNQPYLSKLYAFNLANRENLFVSDFHSTGGYQFALGMKGNQLLFDQQVPNSQNDYTHNISFFNLNSGKKSQVPVNKIKIQNGDYNYKDSEFKMIGF